MHFLCVSTLSTAQNNIYSKTYNDSKTATVQNYFSMIDYIMVENKIRHSLIDSRTYSGTYCGSDHRLLVTRLDIRPFIIHKRKQADRKENAVKYNTPLLTDNPNMHKAYQEELLSNVKSKLENRTEDGTNKWYTI